MKVKVTLKIDEARLFRRNKETYLDATAFIDDKEDKYGNKEERYAGQKGAINQQDVTAMITWRLS